MRWRCDLNRTAEVVRKSKETQLTAKVVLEGRGRVKVSTGLAFLDHMLEQVARYGEFDLTFEEPATSTWIRTTLSRTRAS
jgi:imidazoleglycerol phosphate dehydratase HisB